MFISLNAGNARRGSAAAPIEDTFTAIENLTGGAGNDTITGNGSVNVLVGGAGNDTISAGGGNDVINGGRGNDTMDGSTGNDSLVFAAGFGQDTITAFGDSGTNQDVIEFDSFVFASFAEVQAAMEQVGANTIIVHDENNTITLTNVAMANLGADDSRFV
jgi:Ca2+-binding RTX toxin-like protein